MLGIKQNQPMKSLGMKSSSTLGLGNKAGLSNITNRISLNHGNGMATNHVMASGHNAFYPLGLKK